MSASKTGKEHTAQPGQKHYSFPQEADAEHARASMPAEPRSCALVRGSCRRIRDIDGATLPVRILLRACLGLAASTDGFYGRMGHDTATAMRPSSDGRAWGRRQSNAPGDLDWMEMIHGEMAINDKQSNEHQDTHSTISHKQKVHIMAPKRISAKTSAFRARFASSTRQSGITSIPLPSENSPRSSPPDHPKPNTTA